MQYYIEVLKNHKTIQKLPLTDKNYYIGRLPVSDILLDSSDIFPEQAKIIKKGEQILFYNLGKTSSTYVNDRDVKSTVLNIADTIRIGEFVIRFIKQDEKEKTEESEINVSQMRNRIHEILIDKMNLKKISIDKLGERELWRKCDDLLDDIIKDITIPKHIDTFEFKKAILDEALGLGPLENLLSDDTVTEIMVNGKDKIYVERRGKIELTDFSFTSDENVKNVISRIVNPIGRRIDESMPMVDARLKDGSRVNAIIPPLVIQGPTIDIRKFSRKMLTADDLVGFGTIANEMIDFLKVCVESKKNILVSGGTGTGKTSFLNVISSFIPKNERVITIEDSAELRLPHGNLLSLEARPSNIEGKGEISIRDLLKNSLRMRPDRIIIGECRGGESIDMLQAMNTGHEGSMTTIHANSTEDAMMRLETMVLMSGFELPVSAIRRQIASALHLIVQQVRFRDGSRKVTCISSIDGYENDKIIMNDIFIYKQTGIDKDGQILGDFISTGHKPGFIEELSVIGINLSKSIFEKDRVLK
jgi:pilus assembly protein CpaF